ncbi:hypothetical protein Tco_0312838 [Tanacetum coccineum]
MEMEATVTRPCFYTDFMKCQPLNFKGTEGVVGLTRWIEKMESIFNISGCAIENQVKFATCTLLVLKKKMTDKYCPQGEIKKLEIEPWNIKVKGNDVPAYTKQFQELTLICTKFVANETEKVDKYISGLPDIIYGNVKSARPKTLDETIELANDLMDQKLRTYATGADRSFISTAFSSLINIAPTPLENCYDVELANGKLVRIDTIIRDLRGNETLTFCGNESSNGRESRLTVISCSKAQEYMAKGCQVFLAQFAKKESSTGSTSRISNRLNSRSRTRSSSTVLIGSIRNEGIIGTLKAFLKRIHKASSSPRGARSVVCKKRMGHSRCASTTKEKLYAKFSKMCIFGSRKYQFLDPSLLAEAYMWLQPDRNLSKLGISKTNGDRQFLGLVVTIEVIEGFQRLLKSMTKLIRKEIKFRWGEKEEIAFQLIKQSCAGTNSGFT